MGLLCKEGVNEVLIHKREMAKRLNIFLSIALPEENVRVILTHRSFLEMGS